MKHPFNRITDDEKRSAFRVMVNNASSAVFLGGHLVIINKSRTLMDGQADLVFHDSIGKVLTTVSADQSSGGTL